MTLTGTGSSTSTYPFYLCSLGIVCSRRPNPTVTQSSSVEASDHFSKTTGDGNPRIWSNGGYGTVPWTPRLDKWDFGSHSYELEIAALWEFLDYLPVWGRFLLGPRTPAFGALRNYHLPASIARPIVITDCESFYWRIAQDFDTIGVVKPHTHAPPDLAWVEEVVQVEARSGSGGAPTWNGLGNTHGCT
jgi:hypothetical protein